MKKRQSGFVSLITIGVLVVILIIVAGFTAWYRAHQEIDNAITAQAKAFATALNGTISTNAYIPYDLKNTYPFKATSYSPAQPIPATVSYTKLNYTSYRVCVSYQTGFSATDITPDEHKLVIPTSHGRGENCQTIHPYVDPIQTSGSLRACDQLVNRDPPVGYENSGYISTISAGANGARIITLDRVVTGSSGPFTITAKDAIYDSSCTKKPLAYLAVGQPLYIFMADNGHHFLLQEKLSWH